MIRFEIYDRQIKKGLHMCTICMYRVSKNVLIECCLSHGAQTQSPQHSILVMMLFFYYTFLGRAGWQKLAAECKNGHKIFIMRIFAIFATNSSFLRAIANLQSKFDLICKIYHVIVHFLPEMHLFFTLKRNSLSLPKDFQKVCVNHDKS